MVVPVTLLASSLARNATALATSEGVDADFGSCGFDGQSLREHKKCTLGSVVVDLGVSAAGDDDVGLDRGDVDDGTG